MELTLIRHGQSEANAARLWQGAGNAPLTAKGRGQARALGGRTDLGRFDRVVSSSLDRAIETARLAGFEPEIRPGLDEMNLGEWDGLTFDEVAARYPEEIEALRQDKEIRWGSTGETLVEFNARITAEIDSILAQADPDDRILVVAHGGTNGNILRRFLPGDGPAFRVFGPSANTSITRITIDDTGSGRLERYNDAGHLGPVDDWLTDRLADGAAVLDLIRHGVTEANLIQRVQGHADWGLHQEGEDQARRLGKWIGEVDRVYTSPLGRAARTAELAFPEAELQPEEALMEIDMGGWEGRLWPDVLAENPGVVPGPAAASEDMRRGETGETFGEVQARVTQALEAIAGRHRGERVAIVSHGMSLRSFVAGVAGLDHTSYRTLERLANAAFSRVVYTKDGPVIAAYNLRYHLDH